jgi:hypothetical protein
VLCAAGAVLGVLQVAAAVRARRSRSWKGHACSTAFFFIAVETNRPAGWPARRHADTFMAFYKKQPSLRNVQGWRQNHSHVFIVDSGQFTALSGLT